ncbi:Bug family tripartite tricarboxylate transporter substrate binding protein [Mesobacillus subterraneus]|uniref:Tripartite tricarboxylate transporter substrate binding protein n=1 Tax=Mesobacillus subterraneus TaxID=285983 RepID=A0A3R9F3G7_9BACI|nr:tripartite tricarboxylate transporter substrate binding protein [Mesobacillus subterraneus]RSD29032.1 tripartite tricarboxylate transporter substrate binding protein [Mesobacillus subterraneus]
MKRKKRLSFVILMVLLCLVISGCSSNANGESAKKSKADFPNKPVTIIVNTNPGSSVDVMARKVASIGEKYLGQPIVVENKPGGDGAVAMGYVLNQKNDGYTLWAGTKTLVGALNTTLSHYKVDSFQPVIRIQDDPFALGVSKDSPFNNLDDLIMFAKENPGKVKIGGFGSTSAHTFAAYEFMDKASIEMTWIPFDAGSDGITNVMGGHIDVAHSNPSTMKQFVESGDIKILSVASEERLTDFPDVGTYKEQGIDFVDSQWRGLFVKGGTPNDIVNVLHDALKKTMEDPEFIEYMKTSNQYDGYMNPEEFQNSIQKEYEATKAIVEKNGIGK